MKIAFLVLPVASIVSLFRVEPPSYDAFMHRPLLYLNPAIFSPEMFDQEVLFPDIFKKPVVGTDEL
jgi:hypothetical protein